MANTKTKKIVKVIKPLRSTEPESVGTVVHAKKSLSFVSKLVLVALFGTLAYLLAFKYRNLILAGTVNNYPITRYQLNAKLVEKYGKQTFEEMVNEKIISDQISKNKIVVTDDEVKVEMDKMIKQYGSEDAFQSALEQFGLTPEKAKISIKQSMGFKKLIESSTKIEITDQAVKDFFEKNKSSYEGKKLEEVSATIKDSLYQQELYTKSQEMFTNIRKEAKINSFI